MSTPHATRRLRTAKVLAGVASVAALTGAVLTANSPNANAAKPKPNQYTIQEVPGLILHPGCVAHARNSAELTLLTCHDDIALLHPNGISKSLPRTFGTITLVAANRALINERNTVVSAGRCTDSANPTPKPWACVGRWNAEGDLTIMVPPVNVEQYQPISMNRHGDVFMFGIVPLDPNAANGGDKVMRTEVWWSNGETEIIRPSRPRTFAVPAAITDGRDLYGAELTFNPGDEKTFQERSSELALRLASSENPLAEMNNSLGAITETPMRWRHDTAGKPLHTLPGHERSTHLMTASPSGNHIVGYAGIRDTQIPLHWTGPNEKPNVLADLASKGKEMNVTWVNNHGDYIVRAHELVDNQLSPRSYISIRGKIDPLNSLVAGLPSGCDVAALSISRNGTIFATFTDETTEAKRKVLLTPTS